MYEGNPDDVDIELLDLSSSSGLNGREPMVERLMSQIRAMFGLTDAFGNELSDAGGLNAEGTQVEITNSAVAAAHQDTKDKALDKLCRIVAMVDGHCDWELAYVDPESEDSALSPLEVLQGVELAHKTGTRVTVEDGQLQIPDQEIDPTETGAATPDAPAAEPPPDGRPSEPAGGRQPAGAGSPDRTDAATTPDPEPQPDR
jgi:hypothetical protein